MEDRSPTDVDVRVLELCRHPNARVPGYNKLTAALNATRRLSYRAKSEALRINSSLFLSRSLAELTCRSVDEAASHTIGILVPDLSLSSNEGFSFGVSNQHEVTMPSSAPI
jgi:hypothetical protein